MTIQELYIFANKNNLLNKDIYDVINKFNNSSKPTQEIVNRDKSYVVLDKIEWSYEDVIELFSS